MICGDCGETNKPGTEFCQFCGAYLGWEAQGNPAGADDVTEVQPVQPPAPAQVPPPRATQAASPAAPVPAQPVRPLQPARPLPPQENAGHSDPARSAPQPSPVTAVMAPVPPPPPSGCPTCGRAIDPARRFCGHCGEQFIWPGTSAPVTRSTQRSTWWTRLWDSKDRVARRSYRRSLPPLYRWRRVIIAVLALGLVAGGLAVVGPSPKTFVKARLQDLRNDLVDMKGVTAETIPTEASAPGSTPEALTDLSELAWQMPWTSSTQGSPCGQTPTTAVIQLSFARSRIREIDLWAGLPKKNPNRDLQFRPKSIWIAYANTCESKPLEDLERQTVIVDTKVAVDSLRIGVQTAYAPTQPAGMQEVLGFTEIVLRSRPPVN